MSFPLLCLNLQLDRLAAMRADDSRRLYKVSHTKTEKLWKLIKVKCIIPWRDFLLRL